MTLRRRTPTSTGVASPEGAAALPPHPPAPHAPAHGRLAVAAAWLLLSALGAFAAERPYSPEDTSYTIEPGRWAVEVTPLTYLRHHASTADDVDTETWSFGYSLLRAGVARNTELGIAFESWLAVHTFEPGTGVHNREHGTGCVVLRAKQNLFGNDDGDISGAIAPYCRLRTGRGVSALGSTEFGFSLPVDFTLSEHWTALTVLYGDWISDAPDSTRHFESSVLLDFTRSVGTNWSVLFECYYQLTTPHGTPPIGTLNAGVGYNFSADLYVEAGAMAGITRSADDLAFYASLGRRF